MNSGNRFSANDAPQWIFVKPFNRGDGRYVTVKWKDIVGFQFEKWGDDDWRINSICINAFGTLGWNTWLTAPEGFRGVDLYFLGEQPSSQTFTWINRPSAPPPPAVPILSPEQSLNQDETHVLKRLTSHVDDNKAYYNRILLLATDPTTIASKFEESWLADHADPFPLEVFGSYVAYPLAMNEQVDDTLAIDIAAALNSNDPGRLQWAQDKLASLSEAERQKMMKRVELASSKSERLITLPTRGVFAEGKLGHCNVSEEIDNTRFWKWEEHPIPFEAPGISPVTPIQPQPQQASITPTAFPQSLVNIVNPSPVPDPAGLSAALSLLGTPNIFRDMSGRQEVADLLKKLSDNTISIADAANRAREIQAKYGSASAAAAPSPGATARQTPGPALAGAPTEPQQQLTAEQRESQHLDNQEKKLQIAKDNLAPKQQKQVRDAVTKDLTRKKTHWTIVFSSEWLGGGIQQPMLANYECHAVCGQLVDDNVFLAERFTDEEVIWEFEHAKVPLSATFKASQMTPPDGAFSVKVPGLTVQDLHLVPKSYEIPLRGAAAGIPETMKYTVGNLEADLAKPILRFHGTGKIDRKEIKVQTKVTGAGELASEFAKAFQTEATIEIIKLAVSSTLKAATKISIGGEAGIEGTFEILYLVGYEVKKA